MVEKDLGCYGASGQVIERGRRLGSFLCLLHSSRGNTYLKDRRKRLHVFMKYELRGRISIFN